MDCLNKRDTNILMRANDTNNTNSALTTVKGFASIFVVNLTAFLRESGRPQFLIWVD